MTAKPPDLHISHAQVGDQLVITVVGDLDLGSAPELERALAELAPFDRAVAIELDQVEFIDSSGMRALLAVNDMVLTAVGTPVTLVGGTAATKRLIELTGLGQVFRLDG